MRFKIQGRLYTAASLTEVSLRDLLLFELQTEEMGLPLKWSDQLGIFEEIKHLEPGDRRGHPKMLQLLAVTVWATRRVAGEQVTFSEALDFPLDQMEWLASEDEGVDPPRARTAPRKGSGRASSGGRATKKTATSGRKSTSG